MVQYRLQHYPSAPGYQTQVIDYPGNVYSGQNVAYQRYQQPAKTATGNQYQTVRAASPNPIPTTSTHQPITTTTTQLPVTAQAQPIEHVSTPVPASHHQRRVVVSSKFMNIANKWRKGVVQVWLLFCSDHIIKQLQLNVSN